MTRAARAVIPNARPRSFIAIDGSFPAQRHLECQLFEPGREVYGHHARSISNFKANRGEVQDSQDTGLDQQIRGRLRRLFRNGDDSEQDVPFPYESIEILHGPNATIDHFRSDQSGIGVEDRGDLESFAGERSVGHDRLAESSRAHQRRLPGPVLAEDRPKPIPQVCERVSDTRLPELPEPREVLPDLGVRDSEAFAEPSGAHPRLARRQSSDRYERSAGPPSAASHTRGSAAHDPAPPPLPELSQVGAARGAEGGTARPRHVHGTSTARPQVALLENPLDRPLQAIVVTDCGTGLVAGAHSAEIHPRSSRAMSVAALDGLRGEKRERERWR